MQVTDPVCKMTIEDADAAATSIYKGATYYFCANQCKKKFDENPEAYLKGKPKTASLKIMVNPLGPLLQKKGEGGLLKKDPVCGMNVDPSATSLKYEFQRSNVFLLQQALS